MAVQLNSVTYSKSRESGTPDMELPYMFQRIQFHARPDSMFLVSYKTNTEPAAGHAEKLTFLSIKSDEVTDVSKYSNSSTSIEFKTHLGTTASVFEIVSQLPKLETVTIFVGEKQLNYESDEYKVKLACPSVKTLSILLDQDYVHSFQDSDPESSDPTCEQWQLIYLVEDLIRGAITSFPNLKSLYAEIPEHDVLYEAVDCLADAREGGEVGCPGREPRCRVHLGVYDLKTNSSPTSSEEFNADVEEEGIEIIRDMANGCSDDQLQANGSSPVESEAQSIVEKNEVNEAGCRKSEPHFQAHLEINEWETESSSVSDEDLNADVEKAVDIIRGIVNSCSDDQLQVNSSSPVESEAQRFPDNNEVTEIGCYNAHFDINAWKTHAAVSGEDFEEDIEVVEAAWILMGMRGSSNNQLNCSSQARLPASDDNDALQCSRPQENPTSPDFSSLFLLGDVAASRE